MEPTFSDYITYLKRYFSLVRECILENHTEECENIDKNLKIEREKWSSTVLNIYNLPKREVNIFILDPLNKKYKIDKIGKEIEVPRFGYFFAISDKNEYNFIGQKRISDIFEEYGPTFIAFQEMKEIIEVLESGKSKEIIEKRIQREIHSLTPRLTFSKNINRVNILLDSYRKSRIKDRKEFLNMAIVFLVSALETFLKDTFIEYQYFWFMDKEEDQRLRQLFKIANSCGISSELMQEMAIKNSFDFETAKDCLSRMVVKNRSNMGLFNFQSISGKKSAEWCYKEFFGVSLYDCFKWGLNKKKEQRKLWKKLTELIEMRHKIIHGDIDKNMSLRTIEYLAQVIEGFPMVLITEIYNINPSMAGGYI